MKKTIFTLLISALTISLAACSSSDDPDPNIVLAPSSVSFNAEGTDGTKTIEVEANVTWTATPDDNWITVSDVTADSFKVNVTGANPENGKRTGYVTVASGDYSKKLTVTQDVDGSLASIVLTPASVSFNAEGTDGAKTIGVEANVTWTATPDDNWITVSDVTTDSFKVNVTVTNPESGERTGYVTVASGDYSEKLTVKQAAVAVSGDYIFDNFESHTNFTINSPGAIGWNYIDVDGGTTYGVGDYEYTNREEPMAAMIFNPSVVGVSSGEGFDFEPYSGSKYLAFFSSADRATNDWFISPELEYEATFKIAFWAKSLTAAYGLERFKVAYSTTGKAAADFTNALTTGDYIQAPTTWTRYEYEIPATAKYVGINCLSDDAYALFIDDIAIGLGTLPNATATMKATVYTPVSPQGRKSLDRACHK